MIDPSVVRVPLVYCFFTKGGIGYILMEYIQGQVHAKLESPHSISRFTRALAHFTEVQNQTLGPLAGGIHGGILWPENEDLALDNYNLILCHLDIAPRNIIWLADGSMGLLDWESAGFYPRLFEVCVLRINFGKDGEFSRLLLESMKALTEEEETQVELILKAFSNAQRFRLWVPFETLYRLSLSLEVRLQRRHTNRLF